MFTDSAIWRKPVQKTYEMSLKGISINEFKYQLIKLKDFKAEEFETKAPDNPLTWAYLPFTDFSEQKKYEIKAKGKSN